ncbi:hypothetical protein SAY86_024970 [Trapa natans]|uniref:Polygalacturonase n=1 Tax=Trapa natans TaxID=22666 RepID=A0AAN7M5C6_TRANT|nr:hypothetical protein SAY86_024970 [Trapa natans]
MVGPRHHLPLRLLALLVLASVTSTRAAYNVLTYGAKADGTTESTAAFLRAWAAACSSTRAETVYVPKGKYLIGEVDFRGPCKSRIVFRVDGALVAPADYRVIGKSNYWIRFVKVNNIMYVGGSLDARGTGYWACRRSGQNCPIGARSLTFNWSNNVVITSVTSMNSQVTHMTINSCNNVLVSSVKLYTPDQSPNTDGLHVQESTRVTISKSIFMTGDDCISIGPNTKGLLMTNLMCGPGHGISIGSLARDYNEGGVQDVMLTNSVFVGSDNGVRIKTWARPTTSFVKNVVFQNLVMRNVKNPIIIDQNYCPNNRGCPNQSSGVKISGITYKNIRGTSATPEAVTFECSTSNHCTGIHLQDVNLMYMNKAATSSCSNYLIGAVDFRGPCKSRIVFRVNGALVAPADYRVIGKSDYWIRFVKVNNILYVGGNLDARGAGYWACRRSGRSCPTGARSLTFNWSNNVVITSVTSVNSQVTHLTINNCNNVVVRSVRLYAPDQSPNTDGVHVQGSTGVTISKSIFMTGDDCISIGPNTKSLLMTNLMCGPGHGVSIGSLGRDYNEGGVQDVMLMNSVFVGSDNGVRIKTWARPTTSFVKNVVFQNLVMRNVQNPIIIDQNYCPSNRGCPNQSSGVKISGVTYKNIRGTSATPVAVTLECSRSNPCTGIQLQDINLMYMNKLATSSCSNVRGTSTGASVVLDGCLSS